MSGPNERLSFPDALLHFVIGLSDGLIIPLGIATAMQASGSTMKSIIETGLALSIIGAVILGSVNYVTSRSLSPAHVASEKERDAQMIGRLGFTPSELESIQSETSHDDSEWASMQERYGIAELSKAHRAMIALLCMGGYSLGGVLILIPYMTACCTNSALGWSVGIGLGLLPIVGGVKAKITGQSVAMGAIRLLLLGSGVAMAAYLLALLFWT